MISVLSLTKSAGNPGFLESSSHRLRRVIALLPALILLAFSTAFAQPAPVPSVQTITIKSNVLGEDRVILVRVPQGYDVNNQSYPVLYMSDGNAHVGHTSATTEFLARNGRMTDMIVVGINNTDRTRDLTPTKAAQVGATGAPQFPTAGGADNFLKFIETELIPEIEKRYRTKPYRVFAGHSLGGLFAFHVMTARPGLFNSYIAVSPSLQWDNQVLVKRTEDLFKSGKELNATLVMTLGNETGPIEDSFHQMKQLLTRSAPKGLDWEVQLLTDEDHGSVVLRSHYLALRKIYDGWQMPRNPDNGSIAGGWKAVDAHYKKLSDKFHYAVPVPEGLINQVGYQHLFAEETDLALAAFKANVERYPNSANVYDSLAEAYERTGRIDLAAPLYEKAQALGKQNNDPNAALFRANYERAAEKLKQDTAKTQAAPGKKTE